MLYPRSHDPIPDRELFRDPTSEYRCAPFWAWNCDLDDELLFREIDCMKQMGAGGFHMHVRVGMSTKYLSDEFMAHIRACTEKAKRERMLAWLYDEDKWPSGFAGGYVTEKKENRQKYLLLTPGEGDKTREHGPLLARYRVRLDENGYLAEYRRLGEKETAAESELWSAYLETSAARAWFHFKGYADTLSPAAIGDFIHITHDRYRETVGDEFGRTCPAIFTDEPQMTRKTELSRAADRQDIILSFTSDLEDTYRETFGESLLDRLPEVVWELPEGISPVRYRYHDHVTERFARAYSDQIGKWCRENGLMMTGHMMEEGSLRAQTRSVGECMRSYRGFTLPGIDMLCDGREYITAKQSASSCHQQGCPGVLSELYGVTNWDFDFRGHKLQGDWQAALGVTVRVPHLYWASMRGESKRDYPASIGHQSCWFREYRYIEDHFARVNTLMTRGKPRVRVGIIHPIETYWIHYGPADQTGAKRAELDRRFAELTEVLLKNTVDFDYICESTLPRFLKERGKRFNVGEMSYDAVVVPGCETLRSTTVAALHGFIARGGRVIFMGDLPSLTDALPSGDGEELAASCEHISWSCVRLLELLEPLRDIRVSGMNGVPSDNILCAMREDGDARNLFLCHAEDCDRRRLPEREEYRVELRGLWRAEEWDTMTGEVRPRACRLTKDSTVIEWSCWREDSLLLRLTPAAEGTESAAAGDGKASGSYGIRMAEEYDDSEAEPVNLIRTDRARLILHEPNVCLMDMARWRTDGGEWQEKEEMLRLGVKAKKRLGLSTAAVSGAQPWALPPEVPEHTLTVEADFVSDIEMKEALLALEDIRDAEILFNGVPVNKGIRGHFVDDALPCLRVGPVLRGVNTVRVTRPFGTASNTENMFLLGDFGVEVRGREIRIVKKPEELCFGDWTGQGLPFYGGPLTYRLKIEGGKAMRLRLGRFAAPCVTAELNGRRIGNLSLAPHEADLGFVPEGTHTLDITVYPSRINTFGTFHLCDGSVLWFGPNAWRSQGRDWTYGYQLTPSGLLTEPCLYETEKKEQ